MQESQSKAGEKRQRVRHVFERAAARYDVMNDILSGGLHRLWKAHMVRRLNLIAGTPQSIIDVAGGSGDIALRMAGCNYMAQVSVIDINPDMLALGRRRARIYGQDRVRFIVGDAEALPLADSSVDIYTIGFGIRNVATRSRALAEAKRVLRPGGRFACLEFSHVAHPVLARAYRAYSRHVIPRLGAAIAGTRDSYQYLVESIARFPSAADFANEMRDAGLHKPSYETLTGGVAALHMAWRI